jgi:hypothetical protein
MLGELLGMIGGRATLQNDPLGLQVDAQAAYAIAKPALHERLQAFFRRNQNLDVHVGPATKKHGYRPTVPEVSRNIVGRWSIGGIRTGEVSAGETSTTRDSTVAIPIFGVHGNLALRGSAFSKSPPSKGCGEMSESASSADVILGYPCRRYLSTK